MYVLCGILCKSVTLFCFVCSGPLSMGSVATPTPDDCPVENPVTLLDVAYLENAVQVANDLVHHNVNYWMAKYSESVLILNNIKGLLALYNAGEIHQNLLDMLDTIPDASTPPPVPQLILHIPLPAENHKKTEGQHISSRCIH